MDRRDLLPWQSSVLLEELGEPVKRDDTKSKRDAREIAAPKA
jgi:hypothetical protein